MISKLVDEEKTRTAGVTTLGKVIEICINKISSKSDKEMLIHIFQKIEKLNENDLYNFDVKYMKAHLVK
jgi:hypothetical protein